MTRQMLEQRLRDYYRAEAAGRVPGELLEGVWAIPDELPPRSVLGSRRGWALLAATVMLATLLIGGAIGIGLGLFRLPWVPDHDGGPLSALSSDALRPIPCDQTLAEELILLIEREGAGEHPTQLHVYMDGRVINGPRFPELTEGPWTVRRLTADGIEALRTAVEVSGLGDCKDVPITGTAHMTVRARTSTGVATVTLGSGWFRVAPEHEVKAAQALADRLSRQSLGLADELWIDSAWSSYTHDRWAVRISRWEGAGRSYPAPATEGWEDVVLPDGSTFTTFGSRVPPPYPGPDFVEVRCGVIPPQAAAGMLAFLGDPPDPEVDQWIFHDATGGVTVSVSPLLPHVDGCETFPGPAPRPARTNVINDLEPCDLAPDRWPNTSSYPDFGGGWAACESLFAGWLFVSRHPIGEARANEVIGHQFGVGYTVEEIGGHPVYLNACRETGASCTPATAVSVEPYLVILVPDRATADSLRQDAAALVELLDR